jgi:hypothetical protein
MAGTVNVIRDWELLGVRYITKTRSGLTEPSVRCHWCRYQETCLALLQLQALHRPTRETREWQRIYCVCMTSFVCLAGCMTNTIQFLGNPLHHILSPCEFEKCMLSFNRRTWRAKQSIKPQFTFHVGIITYCECSLCVRLDVLTAQTTVWGVPAVIL